MTILDDPTGYTVGWIAALPIERAAATALLDDLHEAPKGFVQHQSDTNSYTWGQIGQHNIVIASLPAGVYGTTSAAATALNLLSSLPQIRIGLLVGIGSAIARPDQDWDIRLGDIVVSQPDGSTGGVIQYDLGKAKSNQAWERKGSLNKPPPILLNALSNLQAQHEITPSIVPDLLQAMWAANPQMTKPRNKFPAYIHQGFENDRLFKTEHDHAGGSTCVNCNASWEVKRDQRDTTDPEVHYGIIASGNTLVKDAATRNKIAELAGEDCVCLEMEAAGIMDRFPCLVIRGICDYADSHKNDRWQRYASATAAAYAKELLGYVPVSQLQASQRAVDMLGSIREAITDVQGEVQGIHTMVRNFDQREVLARLEEQVAAGASFDSHDEQHNSKCLPNTRVELLQQISEWTNNPNAEAVFWLNGMAGTGKSTISRTVAESLARETRLSASFFFKRGEADRGTTAKFFATIAADLTRKDPIIARHVTGIVENDPAIFRKAMREQFDKLILQPLSMVHREEPAVVIVDALDECDKENDIKVMIHLFCMARDMQSVRLKIFLTSRPELPIRLGFKAVDGKYQSLVLHDIPKLVLEHDIALFLENELARIRDEYNASVANDRQLAGDWPGKSNIRILVKMAIPLFIFATTVCRFIADRRLGTPNKQMKKILLPRTRSQLSQLGATYLPVLDNLIVDASVEQRAEILEQFRYVVGSIIVLANPLSTSALALLLDRPRDDIDGSLDMLHSVFNVPSSVYEPVRLLHLSFRDFLLRKTAENAFWVDEEQTHRAMASNCLRVMECLREDICELKAPGTLRSAVNLQKIHTHLAPEVRYACQYWVYHMQGAGNHDDDSHRVYDFLKRHFLHWIEALSLIGRARETLHLIKKLQSLHKVRTDRSIQAYGLLSLSQHRECKQLSDFLDDAEHFILANTPAIERTPLQLYSSVLTFAPENSKVRTTFKDQLAPWILLEPQVESNWSQMLQTLEGHSDDVTLVTFSPDSTLIVSAARDKTVRVWRAETGESIQTLKGCSGRSVAFSPDSMLITLASDDLTIRIWHIETGECVRTLEGHSDDVRSIAFSPDGTLIVSASSDRTVRLWRAETGECVQTLEGHSDWVSLAAFSPDGTLIASTSYDRTVRLWRAETGECVQTLEGHGAYVKSIAFSPDSTLITLTSAYLTVLLWRAGTECMQRFNGHSGQVGSLGFSPDSTLIVSASSDKTVRVWRAETGECVQTIEDDCNMFSAVAISPDLKLIALTSDDTVRVWRAGISERMRTPPGHSDSVTSLAFSPDLRFVASASYDKTVRVWRAETGECVQMLKGRSDDIRSVAFSPDSTLIASASIGTMVEVWRAETGECVQTLYGHSNYISSLAFSHDGALIASASWDRTVRLWRAETGECVQTLKGHSDNVRSVAFSSDSKLIALASSNKTVEVWRAGTGECVQTFNSSGDAVVTFSPDSTLIALASNDKTVGVWRAETGECVQTLYGHSNYISSLAFSHDGTLIASASWDRTVRLWRAETGECVQNDDLGFASKHLSFDTDAKCLLTDAGAITIHADTYADLSIQLEPSTVAVSRSGISISQDLRWVAWNGENILRLPTDFRWYCSVILGSTVMIGSRSGSVIIMRFSLHELAKTWSK